MINSVQETSGNMAEKKCLPHKGTKAKKITSNQPKLSENTAI
jgi:hypothetical protein